MAQKENRYIYNGDPPVQASRGYAVRRNVKGTRKRVSTFNVVLFLFAMAVGGVLYVHNIITINALATEVGQLETKYEKILQSNEVLRSEVNKKSGYERIGNLASERLGLKHPTEQPAQFTIDEEGRQRIAAGK